MGAIAFSPMARRSAARPLASDLPVGRAGVARSRRGEFEDRLRGVLKSLYTTALSYTHDRDDAEDLVQECVLRAFRSFDQYQDGTSFKAWTLRILTNLCINRFHQTRKDLEQVGYDDVEREAELAGSRLQSPANEPGAELFDRLLPEEMQRAVGALSPEFRAVVMLCDVQELTYQETAAVLGVPIGTVRSRLFRARRLLRVSLLEYARQRGLIPEQDRG